jgi:hypothetical protein
MSTDSEPTEVQIPIPEPNYIGVVITDERSCFIDNRMTMVMQLVIMVCMWGLAPSVPSLNGNILLLIYMIFLGTTWTITGFGCIIVSITSLIDVITPSKHNDIMKHMKTRVAFFVISTFYICISILDKGSNIGWLGFASVLMAMSTYWSWVIDHLFLTDPELSRLIEPIYIEGDPSGITRLDPELMQRGRFAPYN